MPPVLSEFRNVYNKPYDFTGGGHYHVVHRCALANTQAANSTLFAIRNPSASIIIIPTRIFIQWLQTGTHTAAIEDSLDVFKVTGFTTHFTTNKVDLTPSVMRTSQMVAPASAAAVVKGVTVAGAAAGMTGQTLTKDASAFSTLPQWLLAAQPTAGNVFPMVLDWTQGIGESAVQLEQNEGLIVENRVLLGAAANSSVSIEFSYVEVAVGS